MRLELFGAIALTTLAVAACDSSEEGTLGQASGSTGGSITGMGGSVVSGTGGTSTSGVPNGGTQTGNGGNQTGNGGTQTGNGGNQTGNGGNQTGNGGAAGGGGVPTITCPATQPTDGDACDGTTGRAGCDYGSTNCRCFGQRGGGARTWRCFNVPDGGFQPPPGRDGGFTIPDGGFTPPASCTQGSDCTAAGNVCCEFQQGGGGAFCVTSANCTRFGGNPLP